MLCWKQEWAMAFNNLTRAIIHTKRAKAKLDRRANRFYHTYQKIRNNPKWSETMKSEVYARVTKANKGSKECQELITIWENQKEQLKQMIEQYGLSRSKNAARTKLLMEGQAKKRMLIGEDPTKWHPTKT